MRCISAMCGLRGAELGVHMCEGKRFVGTLCRYNGAIGKYDGCVAGCENKLQVRWSMC